MSVILRSFLKGSVRHRLFRHADPALRLYSVSPINSEANLLPGNSAGLTPQIDTANTLLTEASMIQGPWEYVLNGSLIWPSNLLERALELVHWSGGLSWGITLVLYTIAMRSALFPWYLKQTRSTILANNLRPEVQVLQSACQALREQGKVDESHKKMRELGKFMSDKGINPAKILGLSLLPVPFFMATFFAIRNMASQPIASFLNEGLFWFKDLSIADPYYILPALSTLTLLLTMEALVLYFCTSNIITCSVQSMWISRTLRTYFGVPDIAISQNPFKKASFFEEFKASYRAHVENTEKTTSSKQSHQNPPKLYAQKPRS